MAAVIPTRLGLAISPTCAANPGRTGIYGLADPREAFAARALLAAAAERRIDAQSYIWRDDDTGRLLFEALWRAAERGVQVRLLLDDNNTSGLDGILAALDSHPNLEVRLYNPLAWRRARILNYATDFRRSNHRMHNQSFTADGETTIVGGRNVGNEYFGAGAGMIFADLDVLAVGPVVQDVSAAFERYWNSASASPVSHVLGAADPAEVGRLSARFAQARTAATVVEYVDSLRDTALVDELLSERLTLDWVDARLVCDDPEKTVASERREDLLMLPRMLELVGRPARQLDLVSPYFVPMSEGSTAFETLARGGVRVRVLTNSLEATDVAAVHAGYAKRRKGLLEAGVELFELKRVSKRKSSRGSSSASLHAKTFAVDRMRVFVGSFNFDPRSAELNTEMGLILHSPALAQEIAGGFDTEVPLRAYEVRRGGDGSLRWIENAPSGRKQHAKEPGTGFLRRASIGVLSKLPIEWLL